MDGYRYALTHFIEKMNASYLVYVQLKIDKYQQTMNITTKLEKKTPNI